MSQRTGYGGLRFLDLLFTLVLIMTILFVIAFIHMAKSVNTGDVTLAESYLVVMEWNHQSSHDVDIHFQDPTGNVIFFNNKHSVAASLERDDLGTSNDTSYTSKGQEKIFELNREVIYIRQLYDGTYIVNVHMFNKKFDNRPQEIVVEFIKLNPYKVLIRKVIPKDLVNKEEYTAFSFRYDAEIDRIFDIDDYSQHPVIKNRQVYSPEIGDVIVPE